MHFPILASVVTECISTFTFASLLGITIGILYSAIGLKICTITALSKKYKPIIKKKKHDKIVLLGKTRLNRMEVLSDKALINPNISNDKFVLINNVLKEHNNLKEKTNLKTVHQRFQPIYKTMLSYCLKCTKNTESKNIKSFTD